MKNIYPKIKHLKIDNHSHYETWLRIKRQGVWYDIKIKGLYAYENLDAFKDQLTLHKLYWEAPEEESEISNYLNIKPSKNQNDTEDDLLSDTRRVNKMKKQYEILKSERTN